jgi:hypothetical protein
MRVKDILNSSRRLMFVNDVPGFDYSARGTAFLCRYHGEDFAVTARHNIQDFSADAVCIQFNQYGRDFIPIKAKASIEASDKEDSIWTDLAIFSLARTDYSDQQFGKELPYLIPNQAVTWQPNIKDGHLITRGFPTPLNLIDWDKEKIRLQAAIVEADYDCPSPMAHCSQVKFRDVPICDTLDGMSGAPVFWLGSSKPYEHRFAGVLTRASHEHKIGHFINAEVVLTLLDRFIQRQE